MNSYEEKKKRLIDEFVQKENIRLGKDTSNLFRHRKKNSSKLNVKHFNNVIRVTKGFAEVEGMTTYEKLVRECLKHGVMPTIVPELKTITIGGAVTGVGIESSSFKFGLVHETILEMEIITGEGKVITCSPTKNKDLFYGFPNSYGTLGYVLKLKVKVVPVKRFVKLTHSKFNDANLYFNTLKRICKEKKDDFVDGTIFNRKEMYITQGKFVDKAPYASDYTYMKIYYKSIQKRKEDYLKVKGYIWRWDTDWFWCSKNLGAQNKLLRVFLGRRYLNSRTYSAIRRWNARNKVSEKIEKFFGLRKTESVIQDVEIPIENCTKFIDFFHDKIKIKPVWVCPTQAYRNVKFDLYPMNNSKLYMNFGFWDMVKFKGKGYHNKLIEKKVRELDGKKSLYSDSFYSKEDFWKLYNKKSYDKLKKKYDPKGKFLNLYEKCVEKK